MRKITAFGILASFWLVAGCMYLGILTWQPQAVSQLAPLLGSTVSGRVTFTQETSDVLVEAQLEGLTPGKHGIHIHEHGDCSGTMAEAAGGHFNPMHHDHGAAATGESHEGDLGNIVADTSGQAHLRLKDKYLTLSGDESILGLSIIVTAQEDDLVSQPSGNSGAGVACGLIVATGK